MLRPSPSVSSASPLSPRQLRPVARGHIFLSHAPQQAAEVTQLARSLVTLGMTPLLSGDVQRGRIALASSRRQSSRGENPVPVAVQTLLEVVEHAAVVVVCLSPDYVASVGCRLQLELALHHGRRLVPVVVKHPQTTSARSSLEQRFKPTGWLLPLFGGLRLLDLSSPASMLHPAATESVIQRSQVAGGGAGGAATPTALQMLAHQIDEEYEDLRQRLVVSLDRENHALRAEMAAMRAELASAQTQQPQAYLDVSDGDVAI